MVKSQKELFCPDRGDIVWLNLSPQAGREQSGRRPAIVLSPKKYNVKTGLALCCPITSKVKGYPFEVKLNLDKISGAILSDHIKNLDWRSRKAKFIQKSSPAVLSKCTSMIAALIGIQ